MTRIRSKLGMTFAATVLVTGLFTLTSGSASAATVGPRAKMYRVTNTSRWNHEVRKVSIHFTLSQLARRHSVAMANKGYIYHTANPAKYYLKGVKWRTWGENVGVTGNTVSDLQQAFMKSPGHRSNILNSRFRRVAVGTYRDGDGLLWVTVFFYG
jgi:uncharacterized protein YkwD